MRALLGGAGVSLLGRETVLQQVHSALNEGPRDKPLVLASANLDHIYHFGHHSGRESLIPWNDRWLVLLDGMPLVWTSRWLTRQPWEQLAGSDLLPELLRVAGRAEARVSFLGGWDDMHTALAEVLSTQYPTLAIAGYWGPPHELIDDFQESRRLAQEIAASDTDLLVVGLGKPRQEEWLLHHLEATGARVAVAFGAAADFLSGTARRAPTGLRRLGLEWLHRLASDPRRLSRRYLLQGPVACYRLLTSSRVL